MVFFCTKASSSAGTSHSKLFCEFVVMGFSEKLVTKAIDEIGGCLWLPLFEIFHFLSRVSDYSQIIAQEREILMQYWNLS